MPSCFEKLRADPTTHSVEVSKFIEALCGVRDEMRKNTTEDKPVEKEDTTETPDLENDPEWGTLQEAAEKWEVTRPNISYYIREKGVPSQQALGYIVIEKPDMIYVHLPSLAKAKAGRLHDAGKGSFIKGDNPEPLGNVEDKRS